MNLKCSRLLYENLNNASKKAEKYWAQYVKELLVEQAFAYKVCGILEPQ